MLLYKSSHVVQYVTSQKIYHVQSGNEKTRLEMHQVMSSQLNEKVQSTDHVLYTVSFT